MGAVELDRQGIERRDFSIVRRGYDPASVDAHLRALAADVEELQREASNRGRDSLAFAAGTQVQGILEAAQATAETIEREAAQDAQRVRAAADADARRTREEAVAHAQQHVAGVSKATEQLLERVGSMDGESRALIESLRTGASRLASDLTAVETNMGSLYDAAAGRSGGERLAQAGSQHNGLTQIAAGGLVEGSEDPSVQSLSELHEDSHSTVAHAEPKPGAQLDSHVEVDVESGTGGLASEEQSPFTGDEYVDEVAHTSTSEDLDGARLVALNMALNGDSREETGRYLADNFDVSDRERLLDEVYAAIEG
jgi:DivIVA domain-containing protein